MTLLKSTSGIRCASPPTPNFPLQGVFEGYDAILDAACEARNQLIDKPWKVMSIGMRNWAHCDQTQ